MTLEKKSSFFSGLPYCASRSSVFCKMVFKNSSPERPLVQLKISTRVERTSETEELESNINIHGIDMNEQTHSGRPIAGLTNHSRQHSRLSFVCAPSRNH